MDEIFFLLVPKNGGGKYVIVRRCGDTKCKNLHIETTVDDEFSGQMIVRELNAGSTAKLISEQLSSK